MAKQTFTTGQVLTAAQMTSLQQTAMGGGAATAKTASYVLVAADAGTTVAMNAAGATTITVNTGLFAAGDTVFIQNLGAGACTVTAGTATVATAGSLILPQNDAGILYFTSASAAIFYDYIQVGATSPLTTKGDLYTYGTSDTRLGVGANGTTLVADSSEATGLKWQAASGGGASWSSVGSAALTGATSITISGISGADKLFITVSEASSANASARFYMQVNSDTGTNYNFYGANITASASWSESSLASASVNSYDEINVGLMSNNAASKVGACIQFTGGCNTSGIKTFNVFGSGNSVSLSVGQGAFIHGGFYAGTSTISSVTLNSTSGNFDNGTLTVYKSA